MLRLSWLKFLDYFFTPKTPSFAALAGILIFCCIFGLKPVRAFLFCFTSLPKPAIIAELHEVLQNAFGWSGEHDDSDAIWAISRPSPWL
jgi:hypothetical protein